MVCSLIDECRCYSYEDDKKQFCGVRRGPDVLPCDEDCCFGGCPDDGSSCLLYTSPSPRDYAASRMPSSA